MNTCFLAQMKSSKTESTQKTTKLSNWIFGLSFEAEILEYKVCSRKTVLSSSCESLFKLRKLKLYDVGGFI